MPTLPDLQVLAAGHSDWHIMDWRTLERKTYSDFWTLGGHKWFDKPFHATLQIAHTGRRILLFPQGNNQADACAAYVECQPEEYDENYAAQEQPEWACCAQFMIIMWNKNDPTIYHEHGKIEMPNRPGVR